MYFKALHTIMAKNGMVICCLIATIWNKNFEPSFPILQ